MKRLLTLLLVLSLAVLAFGDISTNTVFTGGDIPDTTNYRDAVRSYLLGNALELDGSSQYAYIDGSPAALQLEKDDVIFSVWIKTSYTGANQNIFDADDGDFIFFIETDGDFYLQVYDGTNTTRLNTAPSFDVRDGECHHIIGILDYSAGRWWVWIDGEYDITEQDGSPVTNAISFTEFQISRDTLPFNGQIDEFRLFRFGVDGLHVTNPTGGGANLKIEVGGSGGDLIYEDGNDESLIAKSFKNPQYTLTQLGFGGLEDADPETVFNTSNTENLNYDTFDGISATGFHAVSSSGTKYGGTADEIPCIAGDIYKVSFDLILTSGQGPRLQTKDYLAGTPSVTIVNYGVITASGSYSYTWKEEYTGTGVLQFLNTSATEYTISNLEITRMGEVAYYKMNESGTPSTLVDQTSNGLNLTTSGDPEMVLNDYDYMHMAGGWFDKLYADEFFLYDDLTPPDSLRDLGSTTLPWANVYADAFNTGRSDFAEMWEISVNEGAWKQIATPLKTEFTLKNNKFYALNSAFIGYSDIAIPDTSKEEYVTSDKIIESDSKTELESSADIGKVVSDISLPIAETEINVVEEKVRAKHILDLYDMEWHEGTGWQKFTLKPQYLKFVKDTVRYYWNVKETNIQPGAVVVLDKTTKRTRDVLLNTTNGYSGWWGVVTDNAGFIGNRDARNGIPVTAIGMVNAYVRGPVAIDDPLEPASYGGLKKASAKTRAYCMEEITDTSIKKIQVWIGGQ